MTTKAVLTVKGLSPTQVNAIGYGARYSTLADNYSVTADDVYLEATLRALERKGYLGEKTALGGHRWLTPAGLKIKSDFDKAHVAKFPAQYHD